MQIHRRLIQMLAILYLTALAMGCVASRHPTAPSSLGRSASSAEMLAVIAEPGPVALETIVAADWSVPLSGLLNLDHPVAKQAGLEDGEEAIQIYFHVLEHPRFGTYIVDSGVADAFRRSDDNPHLSFIIEMAMNTDALEVRMTTGEWMRERGVKPAGVFLTHIHLDHIMGLPDLASDTPVYTGPAETGDNADDIFRGVVDVFGDQSVWALHVPGHSPGSTAFVVRTTAGPVLLVGDASHTSWGWRNGVEPGTFSDDKEGSADSLARLRSLVTRVPQLEVRLGHQPFETRVAARH
jgi:glyoxylase-like metal-dependent hydrolase (beta-lactamase superfamily II)